ncbi:alpha,alpha-trehalase TreF [Spirosoma lituiforme]
MINSALPQSSDQLFGDLFTDVQLAHVFADSKTFVDCTPKCDPAEIMAQYQRQKNQPDFDLSAFVHAYFNEPEKVADKYVSDTSINTAEHINRLWEHLTHPADGDPITGNSRIPLPYPYVVPGGRFREIFYWDTYFTMLGLKEANRVDLIRDMLNNFAFLIDEFGFIPNGNRTYFMSRSQPPFFTLMVELLADIAGPETWAIYKPQLLREYDFWMQNQEALTDEITLHSRVAKVAGKYVLNRYWDESSEPRPESYREEIELAHMAEPLGVVPAELYNHIRAACESGWDFSSRWLRDQHTMTSIHASDIVSVDLNCLLYSLESALHNVTGEPDSDVSPDEKFTALSRQRARAIQELFWNEDTGFFHDYDVVAGRQTDALTLSGVFPLFFKLATPEQAARVHDLLKADFLQPGGWVTTLHQTGQQWDWPNGWAPLQWVVYQALINYGFVETAREGRNRWMSLNDKVFRATGKMMEKYNVVQASLTTGGGEYPNQDGFGWTNGVYLAMDKDVTSE